MKRIWKWVGRGVLSMLVFTVVAGFASYVQHARTMHRLEAAFQRNIEIDYKAHGPMEWFEAWRYPSATGPSIASPSLTRSCFERIESMLPPHQLRGENGEHIDERFINPQIIGAIFGSVDEIGVYYFERLTPEFEDAMRGLSGVRKITFAGQVVYRDDRDPALALRSDAIRVVEAIVPIPTLEELELTDFAITDEALAKLRGHTGLRKLTLDGSRITSNSLPVFESLVHLEELVFDTAPDIPPPAMLGLKQRHSLLIIRYNPDDYWRKHPDEMPADEFPYDEVFFATPVALAASPP